MDTTNESASRTNYTNYLLQTTAKRENRKRYSLVSAKSFAQEEEDELLDGLEDFIKQTWNMWGVSLLFNFRGDDEVQLKLYAKKLREELAAILDQENVTYEATVTILDINRPKETDHPVMKIEVIAKVEGENEKVTNVYKGYFLSWQSDMMVPPENSARLPLVICRGTKNTMKAVHLTISHMFDCTFLPLTTDQDDLRWLMTIMLSPGVGYESSKKNDEVRLEYVIPDLPIQENITVKFPMESVVSLWNSILGDKNEIDVEETEQFFEVLHEQMLSVGGLQLGLCLLHSISLPTITVAQNKMKVANLDAMNSALIFFNTKALDMLHIIGPNHSISK